MATIQSIASEIYKNIITREENKETRYFLADDAPAYISEIRTKMGATLGHPELETFYDFWNETAGRLSDIDEDADEDDARDAIREIEADVYTSDLTRWLNRSNFHVEYLTQVMEEYGPFDDGFKLLSAAQQTHKQEVGDALVSAIVEYLEGLDEDSEDEDDAEGEE